MARLRVRVNVCQMCVNVVIGYPQLTSENQCIMAEPFKPAGAAIYSQANAEVASSRIISLPELYPIFLSFTKRVHAPS